MGSRKRLVKRAVKVIRAEEGREGTPERSTNEDGIFCCQLQTRQRREEDALPSHAVEEQLSQAGSAQDELPDWRPSGIKKNCKSDHPNR